METAPKISRIAILQCKGIRVEQGLEGTLAAATALGVHPQLLEVREADDYETVFVAAMRARAGAMVVFDCYFNTWNSARIVALAIKRHG